MKYNEIKPQADSVKKRTRKGRGNASGKGGECGRGHKGQQSRSGYSRKLGFEGGQNPLYRRIPKLRGIKNFSKTNFVVVNLDFFERFSDQDTFDLDFFLDNKVIKRNEKLKVLGQGNLSRKLKISAHSFSKTAIEKLEKTGSETITV